MQKPADLELHCFPQDKRESNLEKKCEVQIQYFNMAKVSRGRALDSRLRG